MIIFQAYKQKCNASRRVCKIDLSGSIYVYIGFPDDEYKFNYVGFGGCRMLGFALSAVGPKNIFGPIEPKYFGGA